MLLDHIKKRREKVQQRNETEREAKELSQSRDCKQIDTISQPTFSSDLTLKDLWSARFYYFVLCSSKMSHDTTTYLVVEHILSEDSLSLTGYTIAIDFITFIEIIGKQRSVSQVVMNSCTVVKLYQ